MYPKDLEAYEIYEGKKTILLFEGDIQVTGTVITGIRDLQGKIVLISFKNCTVTHGNTVLFKPEWGTYDMAVGKEIVSAYAGPACVNSFENIGKISKEKTHKISYTENQKELHELYKKVRELRENKNVDIQLLTEIFYEIKNKFANDWLIVLEIYELLFQSKSTLKNEVLDFLLRLKKQPKYETLITNGLNLLK